jgi:hypothetical protein
MSAERKDKNQDLQGKNSEPLYCPACESARIEVFFTLLNMPVFSNIIRRTQTDALNAPKGDINLGFCSKCGFIANVTFNPDLVDYKGQSYEKTLDISPVFQKYLQTLANKIIKRYNLFEKNLIEIGCGNGYFVTLLCEVGNNSGIGFDPSYKDKNEGGKKDLSVEFIQDYYTGKYAKYPVDLIVCRQTLEHIVNPKGFLTDLRNTIGERTHIDVFFEVPNALNILQNTFCWDVIYEHYSYFTPSSLSTLFSLTGFEIKKKEQTFGKQFLCVYAKPKLKNQINQQASSSKIKMTEDARLVLGLSLKWQNRIKALKSKLKKIETKKQRCVVWGAGSKAVTFLNVLKDSPIEYVVDINPRLQGTYIAGTAQQIVSPEFLSVYNPNFIVVLNSIYKKEIEFAVKNLGVETKFIYI